MQPAFLSSRFQLAEEIKKQINGTGAPLPVPFSFAVITGSSICQSERA
jgi:hypothetical protein